MLMWVTMYNSFAVQNCLLNVTLVLTCSGSQSEVFSKDSSWNTWLLWSKRKKEFSSRKLQDVGLQGAYSQEALSRMNYLDEVEPISPIASTYSVMSIKDTKDLISDDDLARNILLFKKGELKELKEN